MNLKKIVLVFSAIFVLAPFSVKAATIYLDPAKAVVGPEDVFEVKVKIGVSSSECVNAGEISLVFPKEILELKDFNSGESLFTLWTSKPSQADLDSINKKGEVVFSGGLPGGYCGKIPGDPGESNVLGTLVFSPRKPAVFHRAEINFGPSQLLLNDGQGTPTEIKTQNSTVDINEGSAEAKDEWRIKIMEDNIPPEPFLIEVSRDANVGGNKYFIVFSTVDKQTGIDHYEILETKPETLASDRSFLSKLWSRFGGRKDSNPVWIKSESPYVLQDQSLSSVIKVKAVDRAGNERLAEYSNNALASLKKGPGFWADLASVVVLAIILMLAAALFVVKKKNHRQSPLTK